MTTLRIAAALFAAWLAMPAARGDEYTSFHHLAATPEALQPCRGGMLLSLPPSWQVGHGVAVVVTTGGPRDAMWDGLVSALLAEHAAVVELVPSRCGAVRDGVTAAAVDALDAATRTLGAGLAVAIGFGPGSAAILEVVRAPAARLLGADGPRYAAAVAMGDGAPAFALGQPPGLREAAEARLGALCRALATVVDGMGATPERVSPAAAFAACTATMAGESARPAASAAARL